MPVGPKPTFFEGARRERQSQRMLKGWATPLVATPLVAMAVGGLSPLHFVLWLALGLFGWTFIEYVLHRWAMHWRPATWVKAWRLREQVLPHDDHHDRPDEPSIWIMNKPGVSLKAAAVAALILWIVFPWPVAVTIAFGGGVGYLFYEWTHFMTHLCRVESRLGKFVMRHHLLHHYHDETVNFGVTTPIWDIVFGTYRHAGARRGAP